MDGPLLMRGFESFGDLFGNGQRLVERNRPLLNAIRQRRAFDKFQDQRPNTISFLKAMNGGDVGMVQ